MESYESLAAPIHGTEVAAGSLNTSSFETVWDAHEALSAFETAIGAPATDVLRFDADGILDELV